MSEEIINGAQSRRITAASVAGFAFQFMDMSIAEVYNATAEAQEILIKRTEGQPLLADPFIAAQRRIDDNGRIAQLATLRVLVNQQSEIIRLLRAILATFALEPVTTPPSSNDGKETDGQAQE